MKTFPPEAFTHHIAVLGKTGSGKTTTVKGFAESLIDFGKRVCAIDPTGVWWGLRLKADGKTSGYPVVIFGGSHPVNEATFAAHPGCSISLMAYQGKWLVQFSNGVTFS